MLYHTLIKVIFSRLSKQRLIFKALGHNALAKTLFFSYELDVKKFF